MMLENEGMRATRSEGTHVTLIYGLQVAGALRLTGVGD